MSLRRVPDPLRIRVPIWARGRVAASPAGFDGRRRAYDASPRGLPVCEKVERIEHLRQIRQRPGIDDLRRVDGRDEPLEEGREGSCVGWPKTPLRVGALA